MTHVCGIMLSNTQVFEELLTNALALIVDESNLGQIINDSSGLGSMLIIILLRKTTMLSFIEKSLGVVLKIAKLAIQHTDKIFYLDWGVISGLKKIIFFVWRNIFNDIFVIAPGINFVRKVRL